LVATVYSLSIFPKLEVLVDLCFDGDVLVRKLAIVDFLGLRFKLKDRLNLQKSFFRSIMSDGLLSIDHIQSASMNSTSYKINQFDNIYCILIWHFDELILFDFLKFIDKTFE
jgi:hypothetical protein